MIENWILEFNRHFPHRLFNAISQQNVAMMCDISVDFEKLPHTTTRRQFLANHISVGRELSPGSTLFNGIYKTKILVLKKLTESELKGCQAVIKHASGLCDCTKSSQSENVLSLPHNRSVSLDQMSNGSTTHPVTSHSSRPISTSLSSDILSSQSVPSGQLTDKSSVKSLFEHTSNLAQYHLTPLLLFADRSPHASPCLHGVDNVGVAESLALNPNIHVHHSVKSVSLQVDAADRLKLWQAMPKYSMSLDIGIALNMDLIVLVMESMITALDWLHSHGLSHMDVKPANIFVDTDIDDSHFFLSDFGSVRKFGERNSQVTMLYVPEDFEKNDANEYCASAELDYAMLCMTIFSLIDRTRNKPVKFSTVISSLSEHPETFKLASKPQVEMGLSLYCKMADSETKS